MLKFLILGSVLIIIGCGLCRFADVEEDEYPRVVTRLGTIEGFYNVSSEGEIYEAYLGIPYAVPITGEQRFEVAQPATSWTGVLSAKAFGSSCMQVDITSAISSNPTTSGSEDCLYLNVYTPTTKCENQTEGSIDSLPVIFFIHGGYFQFGSGAKHGPASLLNELVILVTFNYRLGPLGFLSTEDDVISGNMGLKDQVLAMRWVKNNILSFCGNPENITIIGQSAGGVSVHYHYLSKLTKGLFQRGMSISGTVLNPWAQSEANLEKAKKLATIVGCPSSDIREMVNCLKDQPAENITQAVTEFTSWLNNPVTPFGPVVETMESNSSFINEKPIDLIIRGEVHDLPWMSTTVSGEGLASAALFIANNTLIGELNDNWEEIAPHLLDYNYTISESEKSNVAQSIREHYLGTSSIDSSTVEQIVPMLGDRMFDYAAGKVAKMQASAMQSPVWTYKFVYRGNHSATKFFTGTATNYGVMHIDDLAYVLDSYFDPTKTERDLEMQEVMINIWVSFATDGVPNVGVEWPRLDPDLDEYTYLYIAGPDNMYMDGSSNFGNKTFWESIAFEENIVSLCNETEVTEN